MFPHVYVHVPFCARRCTYCDFAIAVRPEVPVREYLDALAGEIRMAGNAAAARTVYLGGGTPSQLGGEGIADLARLLDVPRELDEFTIEANPDDVTSGAARAWRQAGVTRVSVGVQSFQPNVLAWMHRTHTAEAAEAAIRTLRDAGMPSISLDLIFALPRSLERDLAADLARAVALGPDHVSLYGLTIEPATPLGRQAAHGELTPATDARYEDEYLLAHERLGAAGYRFYEVSNAARPGHEAVHNAAYWSGAPYLGLGPSAHSFDGTDRWWNAPAYTTWLKRLAAGESPVAGRETPDAKARELERLYLGLRTARGVHLSHDQADKLAAVRRWQAQGWAQLAEDESRTVTVTLTRAGWLRLDELVASL